MVNIHDPQYEFRDSKQRSILTRQTTLPGADGILGPSPFEPMNAVPLTPFAIVGIIAAGMAAGWFGAMCWADFRSWHPGADGGERE